ncbi:hypothetical protein ACN38_g1807 [Penicillium nordicum]|uniref:Uncharacterized protein n=1 Tax=Penicillium nordicum TaxID=229535 RepID=A0A0M8P899_9EURO|nr:hypothetical protein ACN38_g1807 [Penicillium nordicum]
MYKISESTSKGPKCIYMFLMSRTRFHLEKKRTAHFTRSVIMDGNFLTIISISINARSPYITPYTIYPTPQWNGSERVHISELSFRVPRFSRFHLSPLL